MMTDRSGTAHELREIPRDLGSGEDLFNTPTVSELRIWVVQGVLVVFRR